MTATPSKPNLNKMSMSKIKKELIPTTPSKPNLHTRVVLFSAKRSWSIFLNSPKI